LCGQEFALVTFKQAWGEDRVYFRDRKGRLMHVPIGWTNTKPEDQFKVVAAGRCWFRTEDLVCLADLIARLSAAQKV
jgi:hypothetical protein